MTRKQYMKRIRVFQNNVRKDAARLHRAKVRSDRVYTPHFNNVFHSYEECWCYLVEHLAGVKASDGSSFFAGIENIKK